MERQGRRPPGCLLEIPSFLSFICAATEKNTSGRQTRCPLGVKHFSMTADWCKWREEERGAGSPDWSAAWPAAGHWASSCSSLMHCSQACLPCSSLWPWGEWKILRGSGMG